uniref:Uncharacterized protein n=1 Tax=Oryza punctata TaxID=4537 RepID=A0A0E0M0Z0_ORYPU
MFAAADEASTFVGHGKQPRLFSQWRTRDVHCAIFNRKRRNVLEQVANARHKSPNEHPFFPEHLLELVVPSV